MEQEPDMRVINLRVAVEQAYEMGYEDGSEHVDEPHMSLTHYKEYKSWLLNTRQDLMALSGMARNERSGLHKHDDVAVMCDGFDSRDEPIPVSVTDTHHTYNTVMSAYDRGFLDKCDAVEKSIPEPDEL